MDPEIRQELLALGMNAAEIARLDLMVTERLAAALTGQTVEETQEKEGN